MKQEFDPNKFLHEFTPVTSPFLPPLEEFIPYLQEIWKSKWLTNNGKFHQELEQKLCEYLGVKYISLFSNGTLALITALQSLKITGEVITTPYSFIATTHSLFWNNIKPVFVDVEPDYYNIDPAKIEASITSHTTAILAVHVYGNPCRMEEIQGLADRYGLKVIYDAAHAFAVKKNGSSILNYGDLSILSFHATKVYNTFEGGAIISHDEITKERIDYLKNFGITNETTVVAAGINAKMNEFQAALGLLQLKYLDIAIGKRKLLYELYWEGLRDIEGISLIKRNDGVEYNYSYFPIFVDEKKFGRNRDEVFEYLKGNGIYPRRYFFPLISDFPLYSDLPSADPANLFTAYNAANNVLCLPLFPDLEIKKCQFIIELIKELR